MPDALRRHALPGVHDTPPPRHHRQGHIVLTMPRQTGDIRELAETAAWHYTKLTRRKAWRAKCRGWMAVFEVTGNHRVGWLWHVHILAVGRYWVNQCKARDERGQLVSPMRPAHPSECECVKRWNVNDRGVVVDLDGNPGPAAMVPGRRNNPLNRCLMQEWHQATDGEARIVHISSAGIHHRQAGLVQDDDGGSGTRKGNAIAEAIKYVVKTQELASEDLADFICGMRSFQRVRWGGIWRGMEPPDPAEHVPQAIIDPHDLMALAAGTIGPLLVPMTRSEHAVSAAVAAGWSVHRIHGPPREGRQRPPPQVLLDQVAATAIANNLDKHTDEIARRLERYLRDNPTAKQGFDTHVPF
ncbi:MAG: hypothetical protein ACYSUI_05560 [Planctomycetota bacterium]